MATSLALSPGKSRRVTGNLVITALPFSLMQIGSWPGVVASMWRTRVGSRVASGQN